MSTLSARNQNPGAFMQRVNLRRPVVFGSLIIIALLAFELFNYSTTDFALGDLLGSLKFLGVRWATILAIAFCGIDFAGIAKLFMPEQLSGETNEVWYLFGAWLLAATMNAMLTWWGVSIAILHDQTLGNAVVARGTLLKVVPIFVAVMVWLIRVLIIGTFSVAGDRLFGKNDHVEYHRSNQVQSYPVRSLSNRSTTMPRPLTPSLNQPHRPAAKPNYQPESTYSRPEPTYSPISMSGRQSGNNNQTRQ